MSTILEADDTGTLRLPPSLLPQPGPGRRYQVAMENDQLTVSKITAAPARELSPEDREAWLKELDAIRARGATGKAGTPLQQIFDEIREDRF